MPVFLSIGYATCHWCHVMAHESFEHEGAAQLLNDAFVCIKVDREERPDLDGAYMAAIQAAGQRGGWPLTAVLDHHRRPWFMATYIPRENRGNARGLTELVPILQDAWRSKREEVEASAEHLLSHARFDTESGKADPQWIDIARAELARRFDPEHGGFGGAPKFPSPHQFRFLLAVHATTGDADALHMATQSLDAIARGGIHDHIGGGFHRYSTDAEWRLPHFEKMLYDQAGLMQAFTDAWKATGDGRYAAVVDGMARYVLRDMQHPDGGFWSAEDADSEGEEGTFYVWTKAELEAAAPELVQDFQVTSEGNFADESTGQRTGANVLHARDPDAPARHRAALDKLLERRANRERPLLDDKVLVDWNGMMIEALADAGAAFGRSDWIEAAARAARFVLDNCASEGVLRHRWHDGRLGKEGFLDDLAWMGAACLALHSATGDADWLRRAVTLADRILDAHVAPEGAFRLRSDDGEPLVLERIDAYDGASPSGNSVAIGFLERLGRITDNDRYEAAACTALDALAGDIGRMPSAHCAMLLGAWSLLREGTEILVSGPDSEPLLEVLHQRVLPGAVVLRKGPELAAVAPWTAEHPMDRTAVYVCRGRTCDAPATSVEALQGSLNQA